MSLDRSAADRLNDHLDAVVTGDASRPHDLDPAIAATVERFFAADDASEPPPGLADHIWQGLMDHTASVELVPRLPASRPDHNGWAPLRPRRIAPPKRGPSALSFLATAALVILTLAGGLATLWHGPPAKEDESTHAPALIRALDSVPGDVVEELLVETTFAVEELPAEAPEIIFYRVVLPPGASLPSLAGPLCGCWGELVSAGVGAEVVQSGDYTLRLDTSIRLRRDGSSQAVEEIPAQTEVVLGPGDTATYLDVTAPGAIRNAGDEPVVVVGVAIVDMDESESSNSMLPTGVRFERLTRTISSEWRFLPPGPVTVSLWRVTLPEGTTLGPYEAVGLEALRVESGAIKRSFLQPGETAPRGQPLVHIAGTSAPFMAPAPGMRRLVTSASDQSSTLLALSIEPAGIWTASVVPTIVSEPMPQAPVSDGWGSGDRIEEE